MMKSPQEEWREFRDTVYPSGMSAHQNRELHIAFFAGMLAACHAHQKISELPEDQAVAELGKYRDEVKAVNQATADRFRAMLNKSN